MLIATEQTPEVRTQRLIEDAATGCFQVMLTTWRNLYELVWANPLGLAPQEVIDLVGTDALKLFSLSAQIGEMLNQIQPGCVVNAVPEGWTYTVNGDGTVTVTQSG